MPQIATTVTPCVKTVELRVVEISFCEHEYYADDKLVATISYDDDHLTQRWVVMVNEEKIFRAATPMLCHRYICIHYKDGTLPVQEQEVPDTTTGNEVMVQIAVQCEQFGFELLDDGIYKDDQKLGEVGCTEGRWWVKRALSMHQRKVPCDSAFDAVWVLSMLELMPPSDEPFDCGGFTDEEFARIEGIAA